MNQQEEISKAKDKIAIYTQKHAQALTEFNSKYASTLQELNKLRPEKQKVARRIDYIKTRMASVISNCADLYISGQTHRLLADLDAKGKADFPVDYRNAVWREFSNLYETLPEWKSLKEQEEALDCKIRDLWNTPGFFEADHNIISLDGDIKWWKQHLENHLVPVAAFRQWAKDQKENALKAAGQKAGEERKKAFITWFNATYKEALIAAGKKAATQGA